MAPHTAFLVPPPLTLRARTPVARELRHGATSWRSHRRTVQCRTGPVAPVRDPVVHYFAYFSNMHPLKLGPQAKVYGRRCNLLETRLATLTGFRLLFNVPGFPPEPVFANIGESRRGVVKGVLYSLRTSDLLRIARSEGYRPPGPGLPFPFAQLRGLAPSPQLLDVEVELAGGETTRATTLRWTRSLLPAALAGAVRPSRRYVQTAVDGARYRGLDAAYVRNVLARIPVERGPLGAFGLLATPAPHPLDDSRDVTAEPYSPFAPLDVADDALRAFRADDAVGGDALRVVELTPGVSAAERELLYFVPGIDGTGRSILPHVRRLQDAGFEVCSVVYPPGNREGLQEIARSLTALIVAHARGRRVNIVAESMGALFAMLCAANEGRRRRKAKDGNGAVLMEGIDFGFMLLLNPGTSFARTRLAPLWASVLRVGVPDEAYRAILPPVVLALAVDIGALQSDFSLEKLMHARDSLITLDRFPDLLPQDVLQHRVSLLLSCTLTSTDISDLRDVMGPNIGMVCTENDRLLPSYQEGLWFRKEIPEMKLAIIPCGGHTVLQDTRFNLAEHARALLTPMVGKVPHHSGPKSNGVVDESRLNGRREKLRKRFLKENGAESGQRPAHTLSRADISELSDYIADYAALFSPVFVGEERLPPASSNRPVILISNHTLLPLFDALFIVERMLRQRGILIKSLASRIMFNYNRVISPGSKSVSIADVIRFGAIKLSPRSFACALAAGEWVLLFPGGARESLKRKSDAPYSLHWSATTEFVRFAALFGAVVVPLSTVGTEDMVRVIADGPEIKPAVDFLLQRFTNKNFQQSVDVTAGGGAKAWKGAGSEEDVLSMIPPIGLPTALDRLYFRFGQPIDVPAEAFNDPAAAARVYTEVKHAVEYGIRVLLERREHDAYRSPAARARFAVANGVDTHPPAGPAWAWGDGQGGVFGEDLQPKIQ